MFFFIIETSCAVRGHGKKMKAKARTVQVPLPGEPDEFFYYEKLFIDNEQQIKSE